MDQLSTRTDLPSGPGRRVLVVVIGSAGSDLRPAGGGAGCRVAVSGGVFQRARESASWVCRHGLVFGEVEVGYAGGGELAGVSDRGVPVVRRAPGEGVGDRRAQRERVMWCNGHSA